MTMMSVITADAPEALLARMEQDLASAPLPPFEDECIVVQSLGMDRWVRQQFARRQGCAAFPRINLIIQHQMHLHHLI
jgi:exodeoxyribonuclease V gamma subunit